MLVVATNIDTKLKKYKEQYKELNGSSPAANNFLRCVDNDLRTRHESPSERDSVRATACFHGCKLQHLSVYAIKMGERPAY